MVFPDGGRVWCSPTSVSMVMAYWAEKGGQPEWDMPVPTVVRGVWDHGPGIGGNWPFNAAFAAAHGLHGKVVRLASLAEVEPWTAAGVPVIASVRFRAGELANAPIPSALGGHLLVVRGFTADGDVLVNDPAAAADAGVARRYDRAQFERVWLGGSNGLVYLIYPPGWSVPGCRGAAVEPRLPDRRLDRHRRRDGRAARRRRLAPLRLLAHRSELPGLAERVGGGFLAADLSQDGAAERAVAACVERYGRLDAAFNVAGISGRRFGDGPVHEATPGGLGRDARHERALDVPQLPRPDQPGCSASRPARTACAARS